MKTIRLTTAQALIRFLENQYVRYDDIEHRFVRGIFMLPGHGNVVGLGQAIQQESRALEIYHGKNEQGQAQAAMAFAKQMHRKQIFACTSSVGPGAANMVTAAANATANHIPLLLLPGDIYVSRQPDPVLQQIEQPGELGISTNDAFRPVCRYWDRIVRPEQLMTAMLSAMRVLTDPADTGAVCIALPQDAQAEAYDYPEGFFAKRVHRIERRPPADYAVAEAAAVIRAAKRPILICGGGVRYSEANDTFRQFAERHGIPFGETQAGKSAVVWTHPLNLGGIGVTGCSAANEIAKEADVVIGVGTRYTDFTTASKWLFPETARFVNLNVSGFQAYKLDAVRVIADAKAALATLSAALGDYKASYTGQIEAARARWARELDRLDGIICGADYAPEVRDENSASWKRYAKDIGSTLTQTRALGVINHTVAEDAVVIGASGSLPGCMQRMWRPNAPNTYNMEYGYSCMGYEVSGALGVKLAVGPAREVYAMTGDGSFNMLHSELITSVQEGQKINVMLFDNAGFGCINNLQVGQGNETMCTELRLRGDGGRLHHTGPFMRIDYAAIARAYGCAGYTVTTAEELMQALEDAKKQTVSTLIDIKVLPKSMTEGYGGWWRVGVAEVSGNRPQVQAARRAQDEHLERARRY